VGVREGLISDVRLPTFCFLLGFICTFIFVSFLYFSCTKIWKSYLLHIYCADWVVRMFLVTYWPARFVALSSTVTFGGNGAGTEREGRKRKETAAAPYRSIVIATTHMLEILRVRETLIFSPSPSTMTVLGRSLRKNSTEPIRYDSTEKRSKKKTTTIVAAGLGRPVVDFVGA
jgi:hypothetical protein